MRLTIIPVDNMVYVDGRALPIDCSAVQSNIHAIQWNQNSGWIEYIQPNDGSTLLNQTITELDQTMLSLVDAWELKREEIDNVPEEQ